MLIPYIIHCSCGHDESFALDAHLLVADQITKYFMEQGLCHECKSKQLEAEKKQ